jgi:hypothetical protein
MKTIISAIGFAVLLLWITPIAMATLNSNSIIKDGIEYYTQTDKSVYNLGEDVQMLYRVTNLRDEAVTFSFPHMPPVWNFWVEKDGENIWRAITGLQYGIIEFTLSPGEYREFPDWNPPYIWHMRDNENNLVTAGEYSVIGGLYDGYGYYDYTKVDVPIEIVPEPGSLFLLTGGIIYLTRKRKT